MNNQCNYSNYLLSSSSSEWLSRSSLYLRLGGATLSTDWSSMSAMGGSAFIWTV